MSDLPWWVLEPHQVQTRIDTSQVDLNKHPMMQEIIDMQEQRDKRLAQVARDLTVLAVTGTEHEIAEAGIYVLGSNARIQYLIEFWEVMKPEVLRDLLPEFWCAPNMGVGGPARFTSEVAEGMFDKTGFLSDGPERPTEGTKVYHGVWFDAFGPDSPFYTYPDDIMWDGMCWTTDIDVADKFGNFGVWEGWVEPDVVLARFDDRGESEYVVSMENVSLHRRIRDPRGGIGTQVSKIFNPNP